VLFSPMLVCISLPGLLTPPSFHFEKAAFPFEIIRTVDYQGGMKIRLLKHTSAPAVPDAGSFEVRFPDGRPSVYFYFDDNIGRRYQRPATHCGEG
jgi:hypothetical protein